MHRPRKIELEELIKLLIKEHFEIKDLLGKLKVFLDEMNSTITKLQNILNQHVIDEESRILKEIINKYGKEKADFAIKVFREHRLIHELLSKLITSIKIEEINSLREGLENIFKNHFEKEERNVFTTLSK